MAEAEANFRDREIIATKIRASLAKKKGATRRQSYLIEETGIKQNRLSNLMNAKADATEDELTKLAAALNEPPDYFARDRAAKPNKRRLRNAIVPEDVYEKSYKRDFLNANQLWLTGSNLRRLTDDPDKFYLSCIEKVLASGGKVKVLMHHPRQHACKDAFKQDPFGTKKLKEYRKFVRINLRTFVEMRDKNSRTRRNMRIRTIDYMFACGLDIMNLKMNEQKQTVLEKDPVSGLIHPAWKRGVVYVRFYPLPLRERQLNDRPIMRLTHRNSFWYRFFIGQFLHHWYDWKHLGYARDVKRVS